MPTIGCLCCLEPHRSQKHKMQLRLGESVDFLRCFIHIHPGGVLLRQKAAHTALVTAYKVVASICRLLSLYIYIYIYIYTYVHIYTHIYIYMDR